MLSGLIRQRFEDGEINIFEVLPAHRIEVGTLFFKKKYS
jgi:hypothetical protein